MQIKNFKIIIIVFVLIVALLAGFLIWQGRATNAPTTIAENNASLGNSSAVLPSPTSSTLEGGLPAVNEIDLAQFTRSFVERYGSYSQESNFENIEDLYSFMTDKMRASSIVFVKNERTKASGEKEYSGVTTKVLSLKFLSQSADQARLKITTQRTEQGGGLVSPRVYYQDIELLILNVEGEWKVDQANWK